MQNPIQSQNPNKIRDCSQAIKIINSLNLYIHFTCRESFHLLGVISLVGSHHLLGLLFNRSSLIGASLLSGDSLFGGASFMLLSLQPDLLPSSLTKRTPGTIRSIDFE